jgi:4-amino-4-deoxychorismate lyase
MIELLETIKIEDGHVKNIEWHNQRCNKSRFELFKEKSLLNLLDFIQPPQKGLYRCRILYDKAIKSVEYIPYTPKKIDSLKIVQSNINYSYKYNDRAELNNLLEEGYDDVIIEKNGLLTDTSIANIAFYNGKIWLTPTKPLLEGTMRAKLLSEKFLIRKNIKSDDIQEFSHFALMNAMIGFQIHKNIKIKL